MGCDISFKTFDGKKTPKGAVIVKITFGGEFLEIPIVSVLKKQAEVTIDKVNEYSNHILSEELEQVTDQINNDENILKTMNDDIEELRKWYLEGISETSEEEFIERLVTDFLVYLNKYW